MGEDYSSKITRQITRQITRPDYSSDGRLLVRRNWYFHVDERPPLSLLARRLLVKITRHVKITRQTELVLSRGRTPATEPACPDDRSATSIPFHRLQRSHLHGRAAALGHPHAPQLRRSSARAHSGHHLHQRCGLFPVSEPLSACTNHLSRHLPVLRGRQSAPHPPHLSLGLETQPDNETVPMGSLPRHRCGFSGHRPVLQRDMETNLALVAGGLGAEHAVKPGVMGIRGIAGQTK
jgi:hypothetical protein